MEKIFKYLVLLFLQPYIYFLSTNRTKRKEGYKQKRENMLQRTFTCLH